MSSSSRSSVVVNAASRTLRRPQISVSRTPEATKASRAWSAVSVARRSASGSSSIRATSRATLPAPITTARSESSRGSRAAWSGWPLYQPTKSTEAMLPGRSSPGIPSRRSVCEPTA